MDGQQVTVDVLFLDVVGQVFDTREQEHRAFISGAETDVVWRFVVPT